MRDTGSLIGEYDRGTGDKLQLLKLLSLRPESSALAFLLRIALSEDEPDSARVEALSGIKLFKGGDTGHRSSAARGLIRILESKAEDLVRGYAAMALRSYIVDSGCLEALERVVRNSDEDLDVRYNAFDSIESNLPNPECLLVYANLQSDPEFRDHVLKHLSQQS